MLKMKSIVTRSEKVFVDIASFEANKLTIHKMNVDKLYSRNNHFNENDVYLIFVPLKYPYTLN